MTKTITAEGLTRAGAFSVVTRELNDKDEVTSVHREFVTPGNWDSDGKWKGTNISSFPDHIKSFATAAWTPEVVALFQERHPYVPPEEPSAEEVRDAAVREDTEFKDILLKLKTASMPQLDAYIETKTTNLVETRVVLKRMMRVLALLARQL